ncbi:Mannose-P-dolichol utilization defect 1 protein [Erysiphe neolycopersici]|uniref:Mannose-P-dolichol utilization defect 1 protein homolog n=1 Tax=Erysiphe neolycopersici TaxID=212602 RepID=A0A420HXK1_9PEZI|nr:Mannose-P-dolichol utilization defect 1 protein [Erysiphe neolycopersici]
MENLRAIIQPVTHNLPIPIRDIGISILGDKCYKDLLLEVDIGSIQCLRLAISKGLGISIIGASTVVKVPQIIKLIKSRSATGLSFLAYILETSSYLISLAYSIRNGFPFSTFGETGLILLQNIIIACLILSYSGKTNTVAVFVAALSITTFALFKSTVIDIKVLSVLQAAAGALGVTSKIPQIITVWSEGQTGQLSAFAVFNFLLGSLARVFTTMQEVNDKLILYSYIAGFFFNLLITIQMIYYWNTQTQGSKNELLKQKYKAVTSEPLTPVSKVRSSSNRRRG